MSYERRRSSAETAADETATRATAPGRRTLTLGLPARGAAPEVVQQRISPGEGVEAPAGDDAYLRKLLDAAIRPDLHDMPVQRKAEVTGDDGGERGDDAKRVHQAASIGISGGAGPLPHLDAIQRSFGHHSVAHVQAHTDGAAEAGARAMGAEAFSTGNHVAFADAPSLHTAAHEAAHVVQQAAGVHLAGGVGQAGDPYERHADAVADRVVRGESAEALLDEHSGGGGGGGGGAQIQRMKFDDRGGSPGTHDTEDEYEFMEWCNKLETDERWDVLEAVYRALDDGREGEVHERKMASFLRRKLDRHTPAPMSPAHGPLMLDSVPKDQWWHLFIEHQHRDATYQGMTFDQELSPGFYNTMMKSMEGSLSPEKLNQRIDFTEYDRMHLESTRGQMRTKMNDEGELQDGEFEPMPHERSGVGTCFPITTPHDPFQPGAKEELLGANLVGEVDDFRAQSGALTKMKFQERFGNYQAMTNYKPEQVPDKVNELFDKYYQTKSVLDSVGDPEKRRAGKLAAIVRLIRALQLGHFYTDANRRLNTILVLNRLLMAEGMPPCTMENTQAFNGRMTEAQLVQLLEVSIAKTQEELRDARARRTQASDDVKVKFEDDGMVQVMSVTEALAARDERKTDGNQSDQKDDSPPAAARPESLRPVPDRNQEPDAEMSAFLDGLFKPAGVPGLRFQVEQGSGATGDEASTVAQERVAALHGDGQAEFAPTAAQTAALGVRGLALVPVPNDGRCLVNALRAHGIDRAPEELLELAADHLPADAPPGEAARLRRGDWAGLGGDMAPLALAEGLGLTINIIQPDGTMCVVGHGLKAITVVRVTWPLAHYHATRSL